MLRHVGRVPKCPPFQTQSRGPLAWGMPVLVPAPSLSAHPFPVLKHSQPGNSKDKTQKQGEGNHLTPGAPWTCFSWTLKK